MFAYRLNLCCETTRIYISTTNNYTVLLCFPVIRISCFCNGFLFFLILINNLTFELIYFFAIFSFDCQNKNEIKIFYLFYIYSILIVYHYMLYIYKVYVTTKSRNPNKFMVCCYSTIKFI